MKVIVPLKQVPDLVEDLEVDHTGKALDTEYVQFKLNEFDDHAFEEAILWKEEGVVREIIAMAVDEEEVDRVLYTALAKGADKAIKLTGEKPADNHQLARAFANAISARNFDLILTGVQSVSDRDGQLGPILATYLDIPCVSVVNGLQMTDGMVTVRKEFPFGILAEYEVDTPAVLGIQAARKIPRYAAISKIRQVQQTMKFEEVPVGDLGAGAGSEIEQMISPEKGKQAKMLNTVAELIEVLKNEGVV